MKTQPCEAGTLVPIYHPHKPRFQENKNRIKDGLLYMIRELVAVSVLFKSERAEVRMAIIAFLVF